MWSIEDPNIKSGTVLPVYMRSNIQKIWVVGLPESLSADKNYKFEISLTHLEFTGNKKQTQKRFEEFAPFAFLYAENLQDRLPIRDHADNGSRQVYRLRIGEIIKILGLAESGIQPIGTSGEPLEGSWYKVMTNDGVTGYCFSNRLKIFSENDRDAGIVFDSAADIAAENSSQIESAPSPASQETQTSRLNLYSAFYNQGPVFSSNNFGTITLTREGVFTWTGFDLLVPHVIPSGATGTGLVKMNLRVSQEFEDRYNGAFIFEFNNARSYNSVNFMYGFDNQGLRLEVIPDSCIENGVVTMRESTPMVLYFFKDSR